ncbi:hypothetical protein EPUS_00073 [Endocarpon pusillum Z07020]|uniref:DUF7779 domain-containing protein n=1 Tax=Endocarpon pusillum (strain Z07020 / HMAS-L-300199) TaxID=1263415 RepID=U1GTD9_ENDPU|nr:uncharacterized protein EPUS_00073 [Endocarpon pusillum Z07020]ERF75281.1 hypothetical protein EPUS_00073 [Endocarpon pusillum Z07020]
MATSTHHAAETFNTTFAGRTNHGLQQGSFSGQQTNNFYAAGSAASSLPRPLPTPSAIIPFRRDRDFVERNILNDVWEQVSKPAARIGLVGLGGVGKSQLAIEYAYRVQEADPKTWIFWVHASSAARFEESYKKIAERAQLAGWNEPKADILGMVYGWLSDENNGRWTMVVDNADSRDVMFKPWDGGIREQLPQATTSSSVGHSLSDYLPSSANGSIVITSRSREVAEGLTEYPEDILDVIPMDEETAVALLKKKLKRHEEGIAQNDSIDLVKQLDYMPLAITQAAAYVNQRAPRITVSTYLETLKRSDDDQAKLLQKDIRDPRRDGQASNSIITTWHISFEHLRQTRDSAARLLALMSLFDRERIPDDLLRDRYLDEQDAESDFEDDIMILRAYHLIGISVSDNRFDMHRLVQFSTRKWLEIHDELVAWQERYVDVLGKAFPTGDYANWPTCQELFPHVEAMAGYQLTSQEHLLVWATIQYKGAWYAEVSGWYGVSERMAQASVKVREAVLGLNDVRTLKSMNNLALVLKAQGKYDEAESMNQRALARREKVLGVDHPDTLTSMSNLASVLQSQGKYDEAELMNQRALARREKVLGVDHPDTLTSMSNLASVLQDQGKYDEAELMNQRVLAEFEKLFGVDHPDTLASMSNLALVLQDQGKYDEAESMGQRVLAGCEKVLGVDHPYTLNSVLCLARLFDAKHDQHKALELYDRAVEGDIKVLGPTHPDTLRSQRQRALLLKKMNTS